MGQTVGEVGPKRCKPLGDLKQCEVLQEEVPGDSNSAPGSQAQCGRSC